MLTKYYRFQVHNSITHHLYTVSCVLHPKSNLCSSPFIPQYSPLPPLTSNHHIVVQAYEFFSFFPNLPTPTSAFHTNSCQPPFIYEFFNILFVSSFCALYGACFSLSLVLSRSTHTVAKDKTSFFYG